MSYHRMYKFTSIGRPVDPAYPTNKAILILMPLLGVLAGAWGLLQGQEMGEALQQALWTVLLVFISWALARELDPDDHAAAFSGMGTAFLVAMISGIPGILVAVATLGLVRIVNRSTGLTARRGDSIVVLMLTIAVIYTTDSPYFGLVAALAFILDGTLREPKRMQWLFGLVCAGGTVVYLVDHGGAVGLPGRPDALFEWLSLLVLLIFALNTLLLKQVHSRGDADGRPLALNRVRGGMSVGLLAALQGIGRPGETALIVAVITGIVIGMAFRKGFNAPASG